MSKKYKVTTRDQFAWLLASLMLKIATKEYQAFLNVVYRLGKEQLDVLVKEGRI